MNLSNQLGQSLYMINNDNANKRPNNKPNICNCMCIISVTVA